MNAKYSVGDILVRAVPHRNTKQNGMTGIVLHVTNELGVVDYQVKRSDGIMAWWKEDYCRKLTKLERALK